MKSTIITAAFITLFTTAGFSQTWNWDKAHSQLNFGITHMGINEIDGTFGSVTAKHPSLTFKSTSFKKTGAKTYEVTGDLTLHGVTKTVVLNATLNGTAINPQNKKTISGFKVTGTIKRTDFGIATGFPTG